MKYLAEMDKLSGFEASIFGASLTIEVVKKTKSLFPVYIMDWGLVLRNNKHAEEYIRSDLFAEESQKLVNLILNKNLSFDFFKKVRKDVDNGIRKLDYFWKIRMKNLKQLSDKRFEILNSNLQKIIQLSAFLFTGLNSDINFSARWDS